MRQQSRVIASTINNDEIVADLFDIVVPGLGVVYWRYLRLGPWLTAKLKRA